VCSHMVSNSSSLFMLISNLILLYNMDMQRHFNMCFFMSM
jgi:argininosuccinate lyase